MITRRIALWGLSLALMLGGKSLLGIALSFPPWHEVAGGFLLMAAGAAAWEALS